MYTIQYLSLGDGPVYESFDPYLDEYKQEPKYKHGTPKVILEEAIVLPTSEEQDYLKHLKNAVMTYGAADASFYIYQTGFDKELKNYYVSSDYQYPIISDGGHAITIVGWDDGYPKENFNGNKELAKKHGYEEFDYKQPEHDGALIIKNSWGDGKGDKGYFYISYDNLEVFRNPPTIYSAHEKADPKETLYYNDQYHYGDALIEKGTQTVGQVYKTGNQEEMLESIAFFSYYSDGVYDISLRIGNSKETTQLMSVSRKYAGYCREDLAEAISIPANTSFELIMRCDTKKQEDYTWVSISSPSSEQGQPVIKHSGISYKYNNDGTVMDLGETYVFYTSIRAITKNGTGGSILYSGKDATNEKNVTNEKE